MFRLLSIPILLMLLYGGNGCMGQNTRSRGTGRP
jgi:hypothetical protein